MTYMIGKPRFSRYGQLTGCIFKKYSAFSYLSSSVIILSLASNRKCLADVIVVLDPRLL